GVNEESEAAADIFRGSASLTRRPRTRSAGPPRWIRIEPADESRKRIATASLRRSAGQAEATQVDEEARLQQLLRRHRQLASARIGAAEQGGNAVGQRP